MRDMATQTHPTNYDEKWREEHANFVKLLNLLEHQVVLFHRCKRPDYDLMLDIVYYMTQYPDRFHHPREDLAYAKLAERDPRLRPAVEELKDQHEAIAASGVMLAEDLAGIIAGAVMQRGSVVQAAQTYIARMRGHMAKEESELFPALAGLLKAEDWAGIDTAIAARRDPLFGKSVEQRYRAVHRQIALTVGCECAAEDL